MGVYSHVHVVEARAGIRSQPPLLFYTEAGLSGKHRTKDVANLGIVLGIPSLPSEAGTTREPRRTPGIVVCHEDTDSGLRLVTIPLTTEPSSPL